ncbi:MAG: biotin carboxylase N-terminal domain-containing protein [Chloroflexota bacterium]
MFRKMLIANRGEIAVRIERTCREMGIQTVALYEAADRRSLHVRLADECVPLNSPQGFLDGQAILEIAQAKGVDAIHPGYGYLAEEASFIRACNEADIVFIGPPAVVVERVRHKIDTLRRARAAGFPTVEYAPTIFDADDLAGDDGRALHEAVAHLGYPVVIKSCSGGRGRGERLVWSADRLLEAARRAQAEAQAVYGNRRVYLERAILPAHQVGVQIVADEYGRLIHLGEREGSVQYGSRKVIEEAPAPCLTQPQREHLWQTALDLARLFEYQNVGTVEFLVDGSGQFYFTEFKARIQVEHPLTEMVAQVDLVREQLRLAAGEPLTLEQAGVQLKGWGVLAHVNAEDPWQRFLPGPGRLQRVRLPGGPGVRVDSYVYSGCDVPAAYDPLVAKLVAWAADRPQTVERLRRALAETVLVGTPVNLSLLRRILGTPEVAAGTYTTEFLARPLPDEEQPESYWRDLAVTAAVLYVRRNQAFHPAVPERTLSGWHQDSRRLPQ